MTPARLTRRRLLVAMLGLAAPLAAARLSPWRALAAGVRPTPAERLAALLADRRAARRFGRGYLALAPHEADRSRLVGHIAAALPAGAPALETASDDALRRLVADATVRDFAACRLVNLEGWYLALTEARLCALAALV